MCFGLLVFISQTLVSRSIAGLEPGGYRTEGEQRVSRGGREGRQLENEEGGT